MEIIIVFAIGVILGGAMVFVFRPKSDAEFLKAQVSELRSENGNLRSNLGAAKERVNVLEDVRNNILKDFQNVSVKVLEQSRESAIKEQNLNLGNTINPFKEQMEKMTSSFNEQIQKMKESGVENKTSIETQIKNMLESSSALKKEASDLTNALRGKKKLQGNWGEIQVERLFEILGWQNGIQFDAQKQLNDGKDIPDYIVNMPGGKHFVVDAKMSLNSYMDYLAEEDDVQKKILWKTFVNATKNHIESLGRKNYNQLVDKKFEYVCMFMPLEHAYIELMNKDKDDIYKFAFDNGVTIATPSLLIPMLRTIDTLMKIEKQNQNVAKIVDSAEKLYEKYAGFTEDYKKIGNALDVAQRTYDVGLGKLISGRGNISGWFEKIKKQGGLAVAKNPALVGEDMDEEE